MNEGSTFLCCIVNVQVRLGKQNDLLLGSLRVLLDLVVQLHRHVFHVLERHRDRKRAGRPGGKRPRE